MYDDKFYSDPETVAALSKTVMACLERVAVLERLVGVDVIKRVKTGSTDVE